MFFDNNWTVSVAHARAAGKQRVIAEDVCVRVNRDGGNMQLAAPRSLVQRLNVFQAMVEPITAEIDFVLRHRIEHERIIRIGRMTQGKALSDVPFHLFSKEFASRACPFRANGAISGKPGASPQEFKSPPKRALKARVNSCRFSIPNVPLVEINAVLAQQLAVFLLKSAGAMVFWLRVDVFQHRLELTWAH